MTQNFAAIILGGTGQVGGAAVTKLLAIAECRGVVMVIRKPLAARSAEIGLHGGDSGEVTRENAAMKKTCCVASSVTL
jgi:uncharacterized protein YbjT (DUF2867 family)